MLRKFLHVVIALDLGCAAVIFVLGLRISFFRANEYLDRSGSLFSLRRPLPSEFSKEYYASYRRSVWLGLSFVAVVAFGAFLMWIERRIYGEPN